MYLAQISSAEENDSSPQQKIGNSSKYSQIKSNPVLHLHSRAPSLGDTYFRRKQYSFFGLYYTKIIGKTHGQEDSAFVPETGNCCFVDCLCVVVFFQVCFQHKEIPNTRTGKTTRYPCIPANGGRTAKNLPSRGAPFYDEKLDVQILLLILIKAHLFYITFAPFLHEILFNWYDKLLFAKA